MAGRLAWESRNLPPKPKSFLITVRERRWDSKQRLYSKVKLVTVSEKRLGEGTEGCCLSESSQLRGVSRESLLQKESLGEATKLVLHPLHPFLRCAFLYGRQV